MGSVPEGDVKSDELKSCLHKLVPSTPHPTIAISVCCLGDDDAKSDINGVATEKLCAEMTMDMKMPIVRVDIVIILLIVWTEKFY